MNYIVWIENSEGWQPSANLPNLEACFEWLRFHHYAPQQYLITKRVNISFTETDEDDTP